ncbi:MAG: hypothetical protein K0U41_04915, partial [Gammaproteobacteria bacterium]|nr:hypothetical protein [Gammaproteobacteria bacterium]
MNKPKHIFVTSIRQDKRFWGIYIALSWALLIAISIIDNTINSVENPNPVFLLGSLGLLAVMTFLFIRPSKMGWSLVVAVHLVQTFDSMFGAFGVLATAKLDGEHII